MYMHLHVYIGTTYYQNKKAEQNKKAYLCEALKFVYVLYTDVHKLYNACINKTKPQHT